MTTDEAAAALGITPRGVRKLIDRGQLRAEKRGRDYWITPGAVEEAKARPKRGRPVKVV